MSVSSVDAGSGNTSTGSIVGNDEDSTVAGRRRDIRLHPARAVVI